MIKGNLKSMYKAFRNNRSPVAFIGSGLSQNCIGWNAFIKSLAEDAELERAIDWFRTIDNGAVEEIDTTHLLAIAREAIAKLSGKEHLSSLVEDKFFNQGDSPSVFETIVRAPFAFYVTTNYDDNIERAFLKCHGEKLEVYTHAHTERVLINIAQGKKFVLKLHGCPSIPGGLVISDLDYKNIIHSNSSVKLMMATIFSSQPVVFMGYGHRDPHISSHLLAHRTIFEQGGLNHFTFLKTASTLPYELSDLFSQVFGIRSVQISRWKDIETILHQISYIRLSDRYVTTRLENYAKYNQFINNGDVSVAWGALMYAAASSEIGRGQSSMKIMEVVNKNRIIEKTINSDPALLVVYLIITGQYLKRRQLLDEAKSVFEKLERVILEHPEYIIPTLRGKALRYTALYWRTINMDRARSLLELSEKVSVDGDPEEFLNLQKWKAVIYDSEGSISSLFELANQARREDYIKVAAWCRYGAVNIAYGRNKQLSHIEQEQLTKAIVEFESIDHLQGMADSYLLMCKNASDFGLTSSQRTELLEMVVGISAMCGIESTRKSARALL